MATKFLLLVLLCALVFTSSNSHRLGMEQSGSNLIEKRFWHHLPYFGGGLGGKGVGLRHGPGVVGFGGPGKFSSGGEGRNGGREGFSGESGSEDREGKGEVVDHEGEEASGKVSGRRNGGVP